MNDTTIRVLVAEDEELIREALVGLLEREPDIEVVTTAADGREAIERALTHRPDVAVVDLQMPEMDGIGVITELGRALPGCAGVILTGHGRPHVLRQALSSGARGFLARGRPALLLPTSYDVCTRGSATWTRCLPPTRSLHRQRP